jgi:uncharacterized membrane protein
MLLILVCFSAVAGVAGYFKARRALYQVDALRRQLALGQPPAGEATAARTQGVSVPALVLPAPQPTQPALPAPVSVARDTEPSVANPSDLETLVTTRWGIWIGGAALLLAAVFLVRYAVEQDLLGPTVRCTLTALLGVVLIAAAEWLRRGETAAATRVFGVDLAPSALAAGGVGAFFGASYAAAVLYGLVPPALGFMLMAAASLAGLALSLRYGLLVAGIGMIGAFVTPALVQTDNPSLPGLFGYLLFVTATGLAVVRWTAWTWLGWAVTIAGAAWVLMALISGAGTDAWAPAFFVPAAAALNLVLLPVAALDFPVGKRLAWVPVAALGATGLLLALDLQSWETRTALLLLAPLTVAKAAREPRLQILPFLAALLGLLLLAGWSIDVTDWHEPLAFPHGWTPAVVQALLVTAALMAGFLMACGLWLQERRAHALSWAALTASMPVLVLAVCYWRVALFETRPTWAVVALVLSAGLTGAAALARRGSGVFGGVLGATQDVRLHRQMAGVHASGAVAALALACGMLLADQWLTLAISLLLPALAWVEDRADLPALRRVALAVAAVVLIRLLANGYVLAYVFGTTPVLNGLLPTYGVPAAAFALAAYLFRQRGDDLTVAVLEAGSVAFTTVLAALEIRLTAGGGSLTRGASRFSEAALHLSALSILATVSMRLAARLQRPVLHAAWRIQGVMALAIGVILLLLGNPLFRGANVGALPLVDWLLPAYLLPAALAAVALRHPATAEPSELRRVLGLYALVAAFAWITLEIDHLFQGVYIHPVGRLSDAELWAWSASWIVYGTLLLLFGLRLQERPVRLSGLAIVALATAKVFFIDMNGLGGLWRVLSFLGLGLVLIGLGTAHRRLSSRVNAGP